MSPETKPISFPEQPLTLATNLSDDPASLKFIKQLDSTTDMLVSLVNREDERTFRQFISLYEGLTASTKMGVEIDLETASEGDYVDVVILRVAQQLYTLEKVGKIQQLAASKFNSPDVNDRLSFYRYLARGCVVPLGNIALADFLHPKKVSTADYLLYCLRSMSLGEEDMVQMPAKDTPVEEEFRGTMEVSTKAVFLNAVMETSEIVKKNKYYPVLRPIMKSLKEGTNILRERTSEVLMNPDDPELPKIADVILNNIIEEEYLIFMFAGLEKSRELREFYRLARRTVVAGHPMAPLYEYLVGLIKKMAEEDPTLGFRPGEDVEQFLESEPSDLVAPTLTVLQQAARQIPGKTRERSFTWKEIKFPGLLIPEHFEAELEENVWFFTFSYQNSLGETDSFMVAFDARAATLDWSFINSPDDAEMVEMNKAVRFAIGKIFSAINTRAERVLEEKRKTKQTVVTSPKQTKKYNNGQPVERELTRTEIRQSTRNKQEQALAIKDQPQVSVPAEVNQAIISLPTDEELQALIAVGVKDPEIRAATLQTLGEIVRGGRKPKLTKLQYAPDRYRLRIGNKVRAILRVRKDGLGQRGYLEIENIGLRKDVYRRR